MRTPQPASRYGNASARVSTRLAHTLVAAAACSAVLMSPVSASEFCVTCAGPDASYACTVDTQTSAAGEAALKLFCITEIAKSGGHSSCSVDKAKVAPCAGQRHALKIPTGLDLIPGATDAPAVGEAPAANSEPPAPVSEASPPATDPAVSTTTIPKTSPPGTVEQAVKDGAEATEDDFEKSGGAVTDAAKSAGSALESAGSAVGEAAKKSWNCVKSLFSDC